MAEDKLYKAEYLGSGTFVISKPKRKKQKVRQSRIEESAPRLPQIAVRARAINGVRRRSVCIIRNSPSRAAFCSANAPAKLPTTVSDYDTASMARYLSPRETAIGVPSPNYNPRKNVAGRRW